MQVMSRLALIVTLSLAAMTSTLTGARQATPPASVSALDTAHPRLWLTVADLPRFQGWATDSNPVYRDGIAVLAVDMKADMDAGHVPGDDGGSYLYEEYPSESYAEFFAFLSLIDPDPAAREDYAARARTLLMHVMNEAVKGPAEEAPFRDPEFATSDRSRWWGEGFGLTVDWIYPSLSAQDKSTIRTVFLRWCAEIQTTGYHRPGYDDDTLVGLTDDPRLLAETASARWAGNNYFTANMRNLGFMAMALDPADDPGGELHAYLDIAIGAHLYMVDDLLRRDAAGGLAPEGFEYSPQTVGYVAQFMLALQTAGQDDPAEWGRQVELDGNPFWSDLIPAYLHSLSPATTLLAGYEYKGPVYQPAWYGDGEIYAGPDFIELLGALGRYDDLRGNTDRLNAIRWSQINLPPGGEAEMIGSRIAEPTALLDAILYFLILDPAAPPPADPHTGLPLLHYAPGIGRLMARTGWDADATWFTYALGWNVIDHQHADGNQFELYRHGEWLTKGLVGYGAHFGDGSPDGYFFPSSEYHNTLALENDPPQYNDPTDRSHELWLRGSQWEHEPAGDPAVLAASVAPGYVFLLGDATNLYNSTYQGTSDITQANRSIVWLAPDTIVVYDRATSQTDGLFKRFWLNLPAPATVDANHATMTTGGGQQLVVTTLLPAGAVPVVQPLDISVDDMADGEPMRDRLLVEAPGAQRDTRFLTVLQAADANMTVAPATMITSSDGSFEGAVEGSTAILFPKHLGEPVDSLEYTVPSGITTHLITGVAPNAGYDVVISAIEGGDHISIAPGTEYRSDAGGVLLIGELPNAMPGAALAFAHPAPATPPASPVASDATPQSETTPATAATAPTVQVAVPAEGGAAADGAGTIVFTTADGHLYRVAARAGSPVEDVSAALDALAPPAKDAWVVSSPDGSRLLVNTERFDPDCAGWPCLAIVDAGLKNAEVVQIDGEPIHPESTGAITNDGAEIVYPSSGGPHALDLWKVERSGATWTGPTLLTGDATWQYSDEPALSEDGTSVVFSCGDQPYGAPGTAICSIVASGTVGLLVSPVDAPPGLPTDGALHHPTFLADGSVIFAADWTGSIWSLESSGLNPRSIGAAYSNDNAPCALADGRIASLWLDRPGGTGLHELKVMTGDGSSYAMLVTDMDIAGISCGGRSPIGQRGGAYEIARSAHHPR